LKRFFAASFTFTGTSLIGNHDVTQLIHLSWYLGKYHEASPSREATSSSLPRHHERNGRQISPSKATVELYDAPLSCCRCWVARPTHAPRRQHSCWVPPRYSETRCSRFHPLCWPSCSSTWAAGCSPHSHAHRHGSAIVIHPPPPPPGHLYYPISTLNLYREGKSAWSH